MCPSEWYLYRCLSCDNTEWVEDIVFDAFPPAAPGDGPALGCRNCNQLMRWDRDTPTEPSALRAQLESPWNAEIAMTRRAVL